MRSPLPAELGFIDRYRLTSVTLAHAPWRTNEFDAPVWQCRFGESKTTIDFRKELDDGTLLTDSSNRALLDAFRLFLCLQTHPSLTGSVTLAPITSRSRISAALHVLDYFLLRSEEFELSKHGFAMVTSNDVLALLHAITSSTSAMMGIYEPERRVLSHLEEVKVSKSDLQQLRAKHPDLFEIDESSELALSPEQTLVARAWLMLNGCYSSIARSTVLEYRYRMVRSRLLAIVIGRKVLAPLHFLGLACPGIDVAPSRWFAQELPAVPVSNLDDDDRAGFELVNSYVSTLRSMNIAREHGVLLLPPHALLALENAELLLKERTKDRARFTTLPFAVANGLLSKAIAFYLDYGEELVNYYLELARDGRDVRNLERPVPPKLGKLGIVRWRSNADSADDFFSELRAGACLHNMLEVLIGAIAILVNTLMARRASELADVRAESIVEEHGSYFLAFDLRKANVLEHRKRALRPMPTIAAEALHLLARLSIGLQGLGYPNGGRLFEVPLSAWNGAAPYFGTCLPDLRRCFDRFCDYHEVEQDELGRRYYVRAHQLRRNFAMLFFWHGSFGGVEVLRYFLGHAKPSMTYRYVTEAIPGKVLRRVKATVAKDLIKSEHSATEALAQLVCERFGLTLNDLHILPERDVVDYIEDLIACGAAEVEPEFLNGPRGEEYRVVYKVRARRSGEQP